MPLAKDLVDKTLGLLEGFSAAIDQVTTLSADMQVGDLSFGVTIARSGQMGLSPGLIEIDSELLYVSKVTTNSDGTGTATVEPWGRGYKSTAAALHTAGSRVTSFPSYPRVKVLGALNDSLGRSFPEIYGVQVQNFTSVWPFITYDVPANTGWVIEARWLPPTGLNIWQSCDRVRITQSEGIAPDTGITVDIADYMTPSANISITLGLEPNLFTAETDDWTTVTGLPLSCIDVICYGAACATLVASQELSRLQTSSVEQQNRAGLVGPDSALTSDHYLEAKYQQRLKEESQALRLKYPVRLSRAWR